MAKFVVFEKVSEAFYKTIDKSTASSGTNTAINLGSGLIAGMAAAVISQPADTMLSKINKTQGLPGEGTVSRLIKISKELGLRGSFGGIGARLFMVGTITAGQFAIYGDIKKVSMIADELLVMFCTDLCRLWVPPVVLRSLPPSRIWQVDEDENG